MTRVAITAVAVADNGYNLTDSAGFTVMGTGAGNGVAFDYSQRDFLVLKNGTGGAAVYTIKVPTPTAFSERGLAVPDETVSVAAAKSWLYPMSAIFKQSDDAVYVDCDVAASILVMRR